MTTISVDAVRRFDAGQVVRGTFGVLRRNAGSFAVMALLLSVLPQLIVGLGRLRLDQADQPFSWPAFAGVMIGFVGSLIGGCLLQGAVIKVAFGDLSGQAVPPRAALQDALRRFWPLLGLTFVMSVAIGLATLVLIIPGLFVATIGSVAFPALILEGRSVNGSFDRSQKLTEGSRWPVFGLLLALVAAYFVVFFLVYFVFGFVGAIVETEGGGTVGGEVASALASGLGAMLASASATALYSELRSSKEGDGVDQIASVFD